MKRILLLLLFVVIAGTGLFVGTGSAQEDPVGDMPRGNFLESHLAIAVEAQAVSQPPAVIQNAMRRGGVGLVFDFYDVDNINMHGFDAELPLIAATGAGHVRPYMSMDTLESGTTGTVRQDRYAQLVAFINLAWSYGLTTTVDIHNTGLRETPGGDWTENYMWGVSNTSVRNRWMNLSTELLARLAADLPHDRFVFQPFNEPISQSNWYSAQQELFVRLRAACADCTIIIGARDWQGVTETVDSFNISFASGPVIVDVHMYDPLALTHCSYPGQINNCPGKTWPGTYQDWRGTTLYNRTWFENHFAPLRSWAAARGVFVNVGEFGTASALADSVQAAYLGDMASIFRGFGFGFTVHEWHRNFGIKDNPTAVTALFQPNSAPSTPIPPTLTPVPTQTPVVPTNVPPTSTAIPSGSFDIDTLINLARTVQDRRSTVTSAQSSVTSAQALVATAQNNLSIAMQEAQAAEQALLDYVRSTIGAGS